MRLRCPEADTTYSFQAKKEEYLSGLTEKGCMFFGN